MNFLSSGESFCLLGTPTPEGTETRSTFSSAAHIYTRCIPTHNGNDITFNLALKFLTLVGISGAILYRL